MSTDTQSIVNKAWNFAHVLRDDGLSYMAYTEQITKLRIFISEMQRIFQPSKTSLKSCQVWNGFWIKRAKKHAS